MPGKQDKRFLGLWPKAKDELGSPVAKAGGTGGTSGDDGDTGDDASAEFVTKDMLDEAVGSVRDEVAAGIDEIKSMIGGGPDDEPEPEGSADDKDEPVAATEDEITAAIPAAPAAFVKSCVAASMTLAQVTAQYKAAARADAQSSLGSNRPRPSNRGSDAAAATGTAAGFRARANAKASQLVAKEGMDPQRALGTAVAHFANADPVGYDAYQTEESQAWRRKRLLGDDA
jgi:hypothetical protein